MNHEILKQIIFDQHESIRNSFIIDRNYFFEPNGNYVITGLRRAGKSTLLYKRVRDLVAQGIDWKQIIYINFEDERLSDFTFNDFNDIVLVHYELSDKKGYFFFDEIQNIDGWEKFVRRLSDSKEYVQITGSNARMLSSEVETTLGGRFLSMYVSPYNFAEYLKANNVSADEVSFYSTKETGLIKKVFAQYFEYGGFPQSLEFIDKRNYVSSIFQKILLGDIAERNKIRNTAGLKILIKKIAECLKDEVSYSKLYNLLKSLGLNISKDAVINYIDYAIQSYLIFRVNNYYAKFLDKESTPKYYFNDNGLLNLFLTDKKTSLLENLVAVTLFNKYKNEVYYLKSEKTGIDIDFYIPEEETLIRVAYTLQNISSERETENLVKASKLMSGVKKFMIITYEEEQTVNIGNIAIEVVPVYKWILK